MTKSKRLTWILNSISHQNDPVVLDVGCGYGEYSSVLGNMGFETIGLDIEADYVRHGHANYQQPTFIQGVSERLPFANQSVDTVLAIEVFEHVSDLESTLSEISRVLKIDGVLVLTCPNRGFPFLIHGFRPGRKRFPRFSMLPLPLVTYLPRAILKRIWLAPCFECREMTASLRLRGLITEHSSFIMPSIDGSSQILTKLPPRLRSYFQNLMGRFDFKEGGWFGLSIAIVARKRL